MAFSWRSVTSVVESGAAEGSLPLVDSVNFVSFHRSESVMSWQVQGSKVNRRAAALQNFEPSGNPQLFLKDSHPDALLTLKVQRKISSSDRNLR